MQSSPEPQAVIAVRWCERSSGAKRAATKASRRWWMGGGMGVRGGLACGLWWNGNGYSGMDARCCRLHMHSLCKSWLVGETRPECICGERSGRCPLNASGKRDGLAVRLVEPAQPRLLAWLLHGANDETTGSCSLSCAAPEPDSDAGCCGDGIQWDRFDLFLRPQWSSSTAEPATRQGTRWNFLPLGAFPTHKILARLVLCGARSWAGKSRRLGRGARGLCSAAL